MRIPTEDPTIDAILFLLGKTFVESVSRLLSKPTCTSAQEEKHESTDGGKVPHVINKIAPVQVFLINVDDPSVLGRQWVYPTGFGLGRAWHHSSVMKANINPTSEGEEVSTAHEADRSYFGDLTPRQELDHRHLCFLQTFESW